MSSTDVARLAARRQAALRRNARRAAEEEEDEEQPAFASSSTLVGRPMDEDDATSAAVKRVRSAHDERRAINQLIYGRLNQIESTEFTPRAFTSSRTARATAASSAPSGDADPTKSGDAAARRTRQQRPEDFMDEEDRAGGRPGGSSGLVTRGSFAAPASATSSKYLVAPARASQISMQLLKASGWRANGAADAASASRKRKPERVFGAALPPGMSLPEESSEADMTDAQAFHALNDDQRSGDADVTTFARKDDTCGIGFVSYSKLSALARAKHDQAFAPLTFVRARTTNASEHMPQPKTYSITVPKDFDGRHRPATPPPPPPPPSPPRPHHHPFQSSAPTSRHHSSSEIIQVWRGKMDVARRGAMLGEAPPRVTSLPLPPRPSRAMMRAPDAAPAYHHPPPPPPPAPAAVAPPVATAAPESTPPGVDPAALEQHRLHLQRLQAQQQRRHQMQSGGPPPPPMPPPTSHPSIYAPPHGHAPPPPPQLSSSSFAHGAHMSADGRFDVRGAISAAAATAAAALAAAAAEKEHAATLDQQAERRKAERRARWGPIPEPGPLPVAVTLPPESVEAFPLAAAFLQKWQGGGAAMAAPDQSGANASAPQPPPSAPAPTPAPSLAVTFPKFVVAGTQEPSSASAATPAPLATGSALMQDATRAIMSNFVEAGTTTTAADSTGASDATKGENDASAAAAPVVLTAAPPPPPANEYEAAARMQMWGPLTRRVEEWIPHQLLYKRFGVPAPSRGAAAAAAAAKNAKKGCLTNNAPGVAVPGFPSFVQAASSPGSTPQPVEFTTGPLDPADEQREERALQDGLLADDDDDAEPESEAERINHGEKPPLDLFKAIFEADDEPPPPPKPKMEPHVQPMAHTQPLFAAAAAQQQAHPPSGPATQVVRSSQAPAAAARSTAESASTREVISIDLDDDDDEASMDAQIARFRETRGGKAKSSKEKFVPPSFTSSVKSLEFVPASTHKGGATKAHERAVAARKFRVGIDGEEDDLYDDDATMMPPRGTTAGGLSDAALPPSQKFLPPPVRTHVAPVLPPAVPAAWPFQRLSESKQPLFAAAASHLATAGTSASAHFVAPPTSTATAPALPLAPPSASTPTALLEQLLHLRKQQKKLKKESKKDRKEKKSKKERKASSNKKKKSSRDKRREESESDSDTGSETEDSSDTDDERARKKQKKKHSKKH